MQPVHFSDKKKSENYAQVNNSSAFAGFFAGFYSMISKIGRLQGGRTALS